MWAKDREAAMRLEWPIHHSTSGESGLCPRGMAARPFDPLAGSIGSLPECRGVPIWSRPI